MKKLLLILIFISFFGVNAFSKTYEYPHDPEKARDPMDALIDNDGKLLSEKKLEAEKKKQEEEARKVVQQKKATDLVLQGIIFTTSGGTVIIHNEIYYEGDIVDKMKILKIAQNGITVLEGDQEHFIKWGG
jgi:type II secretory pathway component PulC